MTGTVFNHRKEPPGNYQYIDADIDIEANNALLPKTISNFNEQESSEEDEPEFIKISLSCPELFCGVFLVLVGLLHITMSLPMALNGLGSIVEDVSKTLSHELSRQYQQESQ